MALTNIYVDPSIAANSGTGTFGDPYGDLQYALNQATHDTTNGTRFAIFGGTAEVLSATLSLVTYLSNSGITTFTEAAPLIFQGCESSGGTFDGTKAEIDLTTSNTLLEDSVLDFIGFYDLTISNGTSGGTSIIQLDGQGFFCRVDFVDCEVSVTNGCVLDMDGQEIFINCRFIDVLMSGTTCSIIECRGDACFVGCEFINSASSTAGGAFLNTNGEFNVFKCLFWDKATSPTMDMINNDYIYSHVIDCTFYAANTSTGLAVYANARNVVVNNVIVGFNKGIFSDVNGVGGPVAVGGNLFYDITTANIDCVGLVDLGNNVTASTNPFVNAASGDFTLIAAERGSGYPLTVNGVTSYLDSGMIQHADPVGGGGGGGVARLIGAGGGLIG